MNRSRFFAILMGAASLLLTTNAVRAQSNTPVGYWRVTYYMDNSNFFTLATQHICFYANGTWKGTFPGWQGFWYQKGSNPAGNGNRVRIIGNYANGLGNDGAEVEFVNLQIPGSLIIPRKLMTGYWTEWRDVTPNFVGTFYCWATVTLTFEQDDCPSFKEEPVPKGQDERRNPVGPLPEKNK